MCTTVRELVDSGNVKEAYEYLMTHSKTIPLCCFKTKMFFPTTGKRKPVRLYSCEYLKRYYTWKIFKKKCKECIKYIEGIISLYKIEGVI
jgi:hypothetical protein